MTSDCGRGLQTRDVFGSFCKVALNANKLLAGDWRRVFDVKRCRLITFNHFCL